MYFFVCFLIEELVEIFHWMAKGSDLQMKLMELHSTLCLWLHPKPFPIFSVRILISAGVSYYQDGLIMLGKVHHSFNIQWKRKSSIHNLPGLFGGKERQWTQHMEHILHSSVFSKLVAPRPVSPSFLQNEFVELCPALFHTLPLHVYLQENI